LQQPWPSSVSQSTTPVERPCGAATRSVVGARNAWPQQESTFGGYKRWPATLHPPSPSILRTARFQTLASISSESASGRNAKQCQEDFSRLRALITKSFLAEVAAAAAPPTPVATSTPN
jgi:hypothetical protein